MGGKEKAVSSNPSTRGATEQDAFLSAKFHHAGLGRGGGAAQRLGVGVVTGRDCVRSANANHFQFP